MIAVLGAGIMGSSVALYLARENVKVVLIDAARAPFTGASRWNEGKIHLGYLYGADPTLNTARKLIPGGLNFPVLIEELLGRTLEEDIVTRYNDRYLIHKDSVTDPDTAFAIAQKVSALCEQHPDRDKYFVSPQEHRPRLLTGKELKSQYNTDKILCAYEVPERSVSTVKIADYYVEALKNSPNIEQIMNHKVTAVNKSHQKSGGWFVETVDSDGHPKTLGPFSAVVNALWEGRQAVDATVGLKGPATWTHRYRLSVFARTKEPVDIKSAVVAVGPFGDIKNYNGRDLYISWYETGLLAEGHEIAPPKVRIPDRGEQQGILKEKLLNLGAIIPEVQNLIGTFEECRVEGGWVYAAGKGPLDDATSQLHRRDRIGLTTVNGYFSVDTGKYSIAPWLAKQIAEAIC